MTGSVTRLESALQLVDEYRADSYGLLRALLPHKEKFGAYQHTFRRGTVLWSIASALDGLRNNRSAMDSFLPLGVGDSNLHTLLRDETVATASVVFETWISFVCMRFDDLLRSLQAIPAKSHHLDAFVQLLMLDDVRHIRNAIAHGTFAAEFGIFKWRDRGIQGELPYNLLHRLNTAIFTLWLSVDAVAVAPEGATIEDQK